MKYTKEIKASIEKQFIESFKNHIRFVDFLIGTPKKKMSFYQKTAAVNIKNKHGLSNDEVIKLLNIG